MGRRRDIILGLLIPLGLAGGLGAAPIDGAVVEHGSREPLAAVKIEAILSGKRHRLTQATGADGRFRIELDTLFSTRDLDTEILYLAFEKTGYLRYVFRRRTLERGVFDIKGIEIAMEPEPTDAADPVSDADDIRQIFHGPYDLYGEQTDSNGVLGELNERLPRHLRRGIVTHLQGLKLPANVAIDRLPDELLGKDSSALRKYARKQNALAVIQGEAALIEQDDGRIVELASEYQVIPQIPELKPGTLHVDDVIPATEIRPSRLSKSLSKIWGGSTVFAMALHETRRAMAESDPARRREGLALAERFLKAQQRELPRDDILRLQIEELAAIIEKAKRP